MESQETTVSRFTLSFSALRCWLSWNDKLQVWPAFNSWLEIFLLGAGTREILVLKYAGVTLVDPSNQKEILTQQKRKTGPIATLALLFQGLRYTVARTDTNNHHHRSSTATPTLSRGSPELRKSGLNPKTISHLPNSGFIVLFSPNSNTKSHNYRQSQKCRHMNFLVWELPNLHELNWILIPVTNV